MPLESCLGMKTNLNTKWFFVLGLLMSFVAGTTTADASHTWGGYHWARTTPQFTLMLGNNLTNGWDTYLSQTSSDWNNPTLVGAATTPLLTTVVAGQSNRRCRMVSGTTQVCNGSYGRNGWLGLASIKVINGTHITQGSAQVNDTYFNTAKYNNPNEKLHVMCQEVAHTFGLGHQSTDGSSLDTCMDYFSNTGTNSTSTLSTKPNAHDFEELNIIYAHLDDFTTVATLSPEAASEMMGPEATEDPNTWGWLVRHLSNGRSSTYKRFNWDGSATLTHVFWSLEVSDCKACDHRNERHD